jgi:DNA primase
VDAYQSLRSLSFPSLAPALRIKLEHFKRRANGEYYGPCPIHKSKNNQTCFSYHPDGRFNCFSCSEKGRGAIDLTKAVRQGGFRDAVDFLTVAFGSNPTPRSPKEKSPVVDDSVAPTADKPLEPYKGSYAKFAVECDWLNQRVPNKAIRDRFGVFQYRNDKRRSQYNGRVLVPFQDIDGQLWGYTGRDITGAEGVAKYLVPAGFPKSRFLFGAAQLKADTSRPLPLRVVYLVESCWTVMKFASLGLPALSPFGWSVSEEQAELLKPIGKGIVYLPDRNKFEDSNASLSLLSKTFWVRRPPLPAGIDDPEQLESREQVLAL